jgi:hypothetical protein
MRWVRHIASTGEMRNKHNNTAGNPEDNRSLGRSRYRWEDKTMMALEEIR